MWIYRSMCHRPTCLFTISRLVPATTTYGRQVIGTGTAMTIIGFLAHGSWRLNRGISGRLATGVGAVAAISGTLAIGVRSLVSTGESTTDSVISDMVMKVAGGSVAISSTIAR